MAPVPIDTGMCGRRHVRAGAFDVGEVVFEAGTRLGWHSHPHACVAVVVGGVVDKRFAGLAMDAGEAAVIALPPEARTATASVATAR